MQYSVQLVVDLTVEYDGDGPETAADLRFDVGSLVEDATFSMDGASAFIADIDHVRVYRGQF